MAGWALGAGILADTLFSKSAKHVGPFKQGAAQWQMNPDTSNYFGSTEFLTDDNETPGHYRDDKYSVQQTMSPQMQALADKMMGMMGRGQQSFTSQGMGSKLQDRMFSKNGYGTPSNFDRGGQGFGQGTGPAEVPVPIEEEEVVYDQNAYNDIMQALAQTRV
jgi:hypothetical protein